MFVLVLVLVTSAAAGIPAAAGSSAGQPTVPTADRSAAARRQAG